MTLFIGDVHGKFGRYETILENVDSPTIQVGDMGVGFFTRDHEGILCPLANPPHAKMVAGGHRFIRGNHDNPGVCAKHSQWIADGHVEDNTMFIGGGFSIDRDWRILNETYWEDEELDYVELDHLVGKFLDVKPEVMVTHDCPETVANHMFNKTKLNIPSRTRQALDSMWQNHKPKLHIFGHWHEHKDINIMGTRFICLAELQVCDVNMETLEVTYPNVLSLHKNTQ